MKTFDISMKVKLCEAHKYFFKRYVKSKSSKGEKLIDPFYLGNLIRISEDCIDCKWETLFDGDK